MNPIFAKSVLRTFPIVLLDGFRMALLPRDDLIELIPGNCEYPFLLSLESISAIGPYANGEFVVYVNSDDVVLA